MTPFHETKAKLEPGSMPFTEGQTNGEEIELQAAISLAISLKRIADLLEKTQDDFRWCVENGFPTSSGEG